MYMPDPIELIENRIERQIDLIDDNGKYPCCRCGDKHDPDNMHPVSPDPSAPLECGMCS